MADDPAGNYVLESNLYSGDDLLAQQKAAGNKASSNHVDSIFVDLKGAMNNRLNLSGLKPMSGDLDMGGNNIVNYGSNNDDLTAVTFSTFNPTFLSGLWNYVTQAGNVISVGDMSVITIHLNATVISSFNTALEINSIPVDGLYDASVCFGSINIPSPLITSSDVNGLYIADDKKISIFSKDSQIFIPSPGSNIDIKCQYIIQKA
ncbi:MAG: hypothetical protein L3J83_03695 [Proteobacteria bacterium]|nr:hypothetical protein [Pseudomonadota bacterium]